MTTESERLEDLRQRVKAQADVLDKLVDRAFEPPTLQRILENDDTAEALRRIMGIAAWTRRILEVPEALTVEFMEHLAESLSQGIRLMETGLARLEGEPLPDSRVKPPGMDA